MTAPQTASQELVAKTQVGSESRAIYAAVLTLGVSYLVSLAIFWGKDVPLFGEGSVGVFAAAAGGIVAAIVFLVAVLPQLPKLDKGVLPKILRGVDLFGLVFAHASIVVLLVLVVYSIFQQAFVGLTLDPYGAALMLGLTAGIVSYIVYLSGSTIAPESLSLILTLFFISGAFASMLTAENKDWWTVNFSALGVGEAYSAFAFNVTLTVSGIIFTTLVNYLVADLKLWLEQQGKVNALRLEILRWGMILVGVMLALTGIITVDINQQLHYYSAMGMAVVFIALITVFPLLMPTFPKAFLIFCYAILGGMILTSVLHYRIGYFNLTAFELVATGLVFVWLIVFVRNSSALQVPGAALPDLGASAPNAEAASASDAAESSRGEVAASQ